MEPPQEQVIYVIHTTVHRCTELFRNLWVRGQGKEAKFSQESLGWYVLFTDSTESIRLGDEKPNLLPGDRVRITIAKEPAHDVPKS